MLELISHQMTNLENEMLNDSRCNPKYSKAIWNIRDNINFILNNKK